ncbi:TPA: hypothetical protein N2D16_002913 [Clostridium botulinum]|nr:hypothetical protein [Clostridium botulinum]
MGYLNEVFNTYYSSTDNNQKNNIKEGFKNIIWRCLPYTKLDRFFKFKISYDNIKSKEVLDLFKKYNYIDYKVLKSRYNINNLEKEDLIKARINSNYGKYFDKEVYLKKDYYKALANYKNIYFRYLNKEINVSMLNNLIEENDMKVKAFKEESFKRKYNMTWKDYKLFVNMCFDKIFDNYRPIEEKVRNNEFKPNHILDWDEDNYILGYVNKSLNGYLKNYISEEKYYKQCEVCGKFIKKKSNKTKYCPSCAREIEKENHKKRNKKWYKNKVKK